MRAVVAGTRWAAPRLTPDKDTFVSTGLPSFQPRPHSGSTVRLLTSSLITPRCTAAPRPCLNHWRYGLWGFWKTCSSYTTGFQFSYFEIYNFVLLLISLFQTMNISKRQCIRLTAHRWRSEPNKGVADCAMELRPWRPGFLYLLKCWRLIRECFLTSWSVAIQEKDTFRLQPTWSVHYEIFI